MFLEIAKAATDAATSATDQVKNGLAEKIASFFDYIITQIPSWIAGFIVLILSIIVAKIAKAAVEGRIADQVDEEHQEVLILSGRVTFVTILVIGIIVALKIAGIDLTSILAAAALGVGFAMQDFIMNFFSGVLILVNRQFTIGDFITVAGTTGRIMEIQSRATILKDYNGLKVIVPNSALFKNQVTSITSNPIIRVKIPLYISYDTNMDYAMKIATKIMKKHPKIVAVPKPSVVVTDYGDSTIDLKARFWVGSKDGWYKVQCDVTKQIWEAFMDAGIVVPYNIVHLETSKDTEEEYKEFDAIAKKNMEAMRVAAQMAKEAKAKKLGTSPTAAAGATNGTTNGATASAVTAPTATIEAKPALVGVAAETVAPAATAASASTPPTNGAAHFTVPQSSMPPIQPPADFQSMEEIDLNS